MNADVYIFSPWTLKGGDDVDMIFPDAEGTHIEFAVILFLW